MAQICSTQRPCDHCDPLFLLTALNAQTSLDFDRIGSATGMSARDAWRRYNSIQMNLTDTRNIVQDRIKEDAGDDNRLVFLNGRSCTRYVVDAADIARYNEAAARLNDDAVRDQSVSNHEFVSRGGESMAEDSDDSSAGSADSIRVQPRHSVCQGQSAQVNDLLSQMVEVVRMHNIQRAQKNEAIRAQAANQESANQESANQKSANQESARCQGRVHDQRSASGRQTAHREPSDYISQTSTLIQPTTGSNKLEFQRYLLESMGLGTRTGLHLCNRLRMWHLRKTYPEAWADHESTARTNFAAATADAEAEANEEN